MNAKIKQLKSIPISDMLLDSGHTPTKRVKDDLWYLSPLRSETSASFKVNVSKNVWFDYGIGQGGNIIALAMALRDCSFKEAITYLSKLSNIDSFSFHQPLSENGKQTSRSNVIFIKATSIQHPALITYLNSRKIDQNIYNYYCKEIHYSVAEKKYFAIGFQNDSGGYELRNKFFKGCINSKDITSFISRTDKLLVFEGFLDYLSLLTIHNEGIYADGDVVVLNSVANASKIVDRLRQYSRVYLYLDNDAAGDKYTLYLKNHAPSAEDCRGLYKGCKDLNDYLLQSSG